MLSDRPPLPRLTRSEWGLIAVLVAVQFTHMVDFVIIMPLGERLMRELALTEGQFGHVVSAYAWGAGVASLLASAVLDRFDRRKVLLAMYAGFVLSTLLCGVARNYEEMLLGRTLAGVFGGLAAVTLWAVVGDIFEPAKRGRAGGALMSSFSLASILGLPVGLLLADDFGRGAPFLVLGAVSAAVWLLAAGRLPTMRGHLTAGRPSRRDEFAAVITEPRHHWAFALSFFTVLGTFTVASFIGAYLSSLNGWSERKLAVIYLVAGVVTLIGTNVVGRLTDLFGRRMLYVVMMTGTMAMSVLVTNLPAGPLWVAVAALSGYMVFAAGRMVPAQAMLLGVPTAATRGAFMSLNTAMQHAATGLAPLVAGSLLTRGADGTLHGFPLVGAAAVGFAAVSLVAVFGVRPAPTDAAVSVVGPKADAGSDAVVETKPAA